MAEKTVVISQQYLKPIKILKWKVKEGFTVSIGSLVLLYDFEKVEKKQHRKCKSPQAGTVCKLIAQEGAIIQPGEALFELAACIHSTVMKDMCAECGADLRKDDINSTASVPMIHSVPELKVSEELAQKIGKADGDRLLRDKKLVLLVDLDQTLIHTTNDIIPPNLKDVYHFQLYGPHSPWYHTRLRPGTQQFLINVSPYFELHICTFGARNYAHKITAILDSSGQFFSNRVLSRDECFNPTSKTANLKALFPCGDHMVCIIDDREDVWSHASNLIHVKPYHFFKHTGDINAPPGLEKDENDEKEGVDLSKIKSITAVEEKADQKNNSSVKNNNESSNIVEVNAASPTIAEEKIDLENSSNTLKNKNDSSDIVEVDDTAIREKPKPSAECLNNKQVDVAVGAKSNEEYLNNKKPDVLMDDDTSSEKEENGIANVNGDMETDSVDKAAVENTNIDKKHGNKKRETKNQDEQIKNSKRVGEEKEPKPDDLNQQQKLKLTEVNQQQEPKLNELNQCREPKPNDLKQQQEPKSTNLNHQQEPKPNDLIQQQEPKPTDLNHQQELNPTDLKQQQEPKPTDLNRQQEPKPNDLIQQQEPKPTDLNHQQEPKPTDSKQQQEPKPNDLIRQQEPKPTDSKQRQEPKPTDLNQHQEPKSIDLNQQQEAKPCDLNQRQEPQLNNFNQQQEPKLIDLLQQHIQTNDRDENISSLSSSLNLFEIEDPDDYLLYLEDILKRIHKAFYDQYDHMDTGEVPDLKKVIPNVKGEVLKGCKMIFSGLVPTHIKLEHSRAYQVAKSLGAKVTQEFENDSTHLVAVRPGTAKVNAGRRRKNLKMVTPDWLWACAERWEHVDENIFPLNSKGSKNRHPPPHCSSPEHVPNYAVHETPALRKRTPSGRFMDTINPLMSFSSADIADMDKEVEDILDAESESEDENASKDMDITDTIIIDKEESSSSSGESLTAEMPRGHKRNLEKRQQEDEDGEEDTKDSDEFPSTKFRRGEQLDSDLDIGQDSNSEGSVEAPDEIDDGEWNMMGAALEREFLSNS